jgi:large subunit ribosomal protein L9
MKVVLIKDVEKVGKRGDVVEVSTGYGVNFLVPQGLAMNATVDAIHTAQMASLQKKTKKVEMETKVAALGSKIDKKTFQLKVKASKSGRLYGSLTKSEVTAVLTREWGLEGAGAEINVDLAQPIRDAGRYPLTVKVSTGAGEEPHDIILSVVAE